MSNGQSTTKNGRKLYYPRTLSEQEVERQLTTLLHLAEQIFGPNDLPTLKLYNDGQFSLVRLPQPMHTRDYRVIVHGQGIKNAKVAELFLWVQEDRGAVLDMFRPADARFMFVQFATRQAFEAVLHRAGSIRGRAVTVQVAERKRSAGSGSGRNSGRTTPNLDFEENGGASPSGGQIAGVGEDRAFYAPEPQMASQLAMQHQYQMHQLSMQLQQMQFQGLLEPTMMPMVPAHSIAMSGMMPMMPVVPTVPMVGPMGMPVGLATNSMVQMPRANNNALVVLPTHSVSPLVATNESPSAHHQHFSIARNNKAGQGLEGMPIPLGTIDKNTIDKAGVNRNSSGMKNPPITPEMGDLEQEIGQINSQNGNTQPGLGWIRDLLQKIPANQQHHGQSGAA